MECHLGQHGRQQGVGALAGQWSARGGPRRPGPRQGTDRRGPSVGRAGDRHGGRFEQEEDKAIGRITLGRALVAGGLGHEAVVELRRAVAGAEAIRSPFIRWQALAALGAALAASGSDWSGATSGGGRRRPVRSPRTFRRSMQRRFSPISVSPRYSKPFVEAGYAAGDSPQILVEAMGLEPTNLLTARPPEAVSVQ